MSKNLAGAEALGNLFRRRAGGQEFPDSVRHNNICNSISAIFYETTKMHQAQ